jgi:hypothetical protein
MIVHGNDVSGRVDQGIEWAIYEDRVTTVDLIQLRRGQRADRGPHELEPPLE